ncbi:MAG: FAD-binding protein [Planctomycetales bacterium]|nr:FAD-binding protein [Planctomycetales bacterium]
MDQERQRVQADLRGLIEGEVRCDDLFVQMYACDASIYEVRPLGVVRPRSVLDVAACVQYAAENNLPIHARGAGSGLAGESLGPGLILDFSHSMRRIVQINDDTVRVQPGVVHAQLNRQLRKYKRIYGPDPATRSVTTMGSVLALDASGSHFLRYGSARGTVESLQIVTADGEVLEVNRHALQGDTADGSRGSLPIDAARMTNGMPLSDSSGTDSGVGSNPTAAGGGSAASVARAELVKRLGDVLERNEATIREHSPRTLVNRCGYQLHDVLRDGQLDLARLLVGSEGTLALITEATIRTEPLPAHRGVVLLFFDRLDAAARGALECAALNVSACDLMDWRTLTIARETDVRFDVLIPRAAEAMLLVELDGNSADELRERMQQLVVRLTRRKKLAFDARSTMEHDERNLYWRLTRRVIPRLYRLKGQTRPLPFIEDVAVPPRAMPDFLIRMQNVLKTNQVTASLFAHAGHGQLHIRPFLDLGNPDDVRRMQQLATDLYEQVLEVGGTISGEHGVGLSRTWFVRRQAGPMFDVFREIKRVFDPRNILNPGKVVADAPQPLTKNLRLVPTLTGESRAASIGSQPSASESPETVAATSVPTTAAAANETADGATPARPLVELQLLWNEADIAYTSRLCNGCARCRTQSPDERMCPIFRFAPAEEASPRAKANLMRAIFTGEISADSIHGDAFRDVAKLCVNCHQCRLECPASVDIPKLMLEAKAQYVATNGLRGVDWYLANIERLAGWGSASSGFANWAIRNRTARWVIEKLFGIAQGRKLPRFASRPFLREASRRRLTRPVRQSGRKVLYFLDLYANWFDVELADAVCAVLMHNGVSVYIPPEQRPSGMNRLSLGDVDGARQIARFNVPVLAEAVRQGYTIIVSEPSAALCLTREYKNLLEDEDARLVSDNTMEICTYLWRLHQEGGLELDFKPIHATVAYHEPCHMRALEVGTPGLNLLRLVPGMSVQLIDRGCSGMAGMYGLKRENYRTSLRAGWPVISALREPTLHVGATECSACKIQMEQGTPKPTVHPLKVLAASYGLGETFDKLSTTRGEELVVT